jgi:hypothetical protein
MTVRDEGGRLAPSPSPLGVRGASDVVASRVRGVCNE